MPNTTPSSTDVQTLKTGLPGGDDFHCFRADRAERWQFIADTLESDPAAWQWALANLDRWLAAGRLHPGPIREWQDLLLNAYRDPVRRAELLDEWRRPPVGAHQDQLRSCSPFVGGPFQRSEP